MYTSVYVPEVENKNPSGFLSPNIVEGSGWKEIFVFRLAGGEHMSVQVRGYLSQGEYISHQYKMIS